MSTYSEVNVHSVVINGTWPSHKAQTWGLTLGPWVPKPRGPEGPGGPLTPGSPWKDNEWQVTGILKHSMLYS